MLGLIIRTPSAGPTPPAGPSFVLTGMLALPVETESAGLVLPFEDEFRVWINHPGDSTTIQLRVLASRRIDELAPLPIVAAGAVRCGNGFLITGADAQGRAVVLQSDAGGSILRRHPLDGPEPIRWPVPYCAPQPAIVWQTEQGKLEVADIGENGAFGRRTFSAGGPPLELAGAPDSIWAVWSGGPGLRALRIGNGTARPVEIASPYVGEFAAGWCDAGLCVAALQNDSVFLTLAGPDGSSPGPTRKIEIAHRIRGNLAVVSGPRPLIWISGSEASAAKALRPRSLLAGPGVNPLEIDGLVYSVSYHDDTVTLLGSNELLFLRRAADGGGSIE